MEKISEMIESMCPKGVKWVHLGDICTVLRGKRLTKSQLSDTQKYPVYHGGKDPIGYYSNSNRPADTVMVINVGASAGSVGYSSSEFWSSDGCFCISQSDEVVAKYLYQYLFEHEAIIKSQVRYAGIPTLSSSAVENIEIPLPPLPTQQEIVRILDSFTQLKSNLEAELAARQKQYEYYRNKLLTFEEGDDSVEWKTLGEIGTMYKGKGIQKADFVEDGMPCIHYGQVHTFYGFSARETKSFISEEIYSNSNKAKKGDIIIATTSEDVEACCKSTVWLGNSEPAISGDAHYFRHNQNPKYIGYLFMTEMFASQKRTAAVGAKVTRVHGDSILKFKFPFPSLAYQQEAAEKLDNFEALIANIKQEIEARKKQYEFYREQLLTFN